MYARACWTFGSSAMRLSVSKSPRLSAISIDWTMHFHPILSKLSNPWRKLRSRPACTVVGRSEPLFCSTSQSFRASAKNWQSGFPAGSQYLCRLITLRVACWTGYVGQYIDGRTMTGPRHCVTHQSTSQDHVHEEWRTVCLLPTDHIPEEIVLMKDGSPTVL